ncbi:MAG: hypothetical protein A2Y10_16010 [Planctomycetes bacterium GWF2_41_51]|nr:MAG: hypothetical protein A2Y10_16010 [Planctomycetes bacterium GWF2_41_51]HBG25642.1 hypothetical protein [Phycisphaerales bacterium]
MSQVVTDGEEIKQKGLKTIVPGIDRAFLVEEFNKIIVTTCHLPDFKPGINVFTEKEDLLLFEEAKLYGHNAIHALLAYLGAQKGTKKLWGCFFIMGISFPRIICLLDGKKNCFHPTVSNWISVYCIEPFL